MTQRQRVFKGISVRAAEALRRAEGYDVEFKRTPGSLDSDDLVAFANSDNGGTILVGVDEIKSKASQSKGKIVGCAVGDRAKQTVLDKAESCVPPVAADVFVENSASVPFLRVEVPPGDKRPYSTSGGTYKIRGDGRNKALLPGRLLAMFVEAESQEFLARFQAATRQIEKELEGLKDDLVSDLRVVEEATERFHESVDGTLTDVASFAETAQYESESASGTANQIHEKVEGVASDVSEYGRSIEAKLDGLLKHAGIPDPAVDVYERYISMMLMSHLVQGLPKEQARERFAKDYPAATASQFEALYAKVEALVTEDHQPVRDLANKLTKPKQ